MKIQRLEWIVCSVAVISSLMGSQAVARTSLNHEIDLRLPLAETHSVQVAQVTGSNCRVPNRTLDLYSLPSVASDSRSLATLEANTRVNLERGPDGSFFQENGFARGFAPSVGVTGYIITRHLTRIPGCGDDPTPPPQATCARVAVSELLVRNNPSETASSTGRVVTSGQEVRVLNDARESATGRTWVQIPVAGTTGWIAETGRFNSGRNLSQRYSCPRNAN